MHDEILKRLASVEREHSVRILFACESGSRAWGFESPDSDYDVRFVYAHPADWYLSFDVESRRDVIEYPIVDDIDCGGWDLRKALYLYTRTNGAFLEWLNSPIRYIERGSFAESLRELAPKCVNPIALGIPPVRFQDLVESVAPVEIRSAIAELLDLKKATSELGFGEPIPEIGVFIEEELVRHGETFSGQGRPDVLTGVALRYQLNGIFRSAILETSQVAT